MDTGTSFLIGPSRVVTNIQKLTDAIASKDREVKGHATGSLLVSLHTKDQQDQTPTSLFLLQHVVSCQSTGALPPFIFTINGTDYPVPPQVYIRQARSQSCGLALKSGTCRNPLWAAAGRRAPSAGKVTPLQMLLNPCGWASASCKTNHVRVKDSLAHLSSGKKCADTIPGWHDTWHKEKGTLRSSALKRLQFNQSLQMDKLGKSALAICEIGHVTKRMAGDSPNVLSHHGG